MLSISLFVTRHQLPPLDQACPMVVELRVRDEVAYGWAMVVTSNPVHTVQYCTAVYEVEWSRMHTLTCTTGTAPSTLEDVMQYKSSARLHNQCVLLCSTGQEKY